MTDREKLIAFMNNVQDYGTKQTYEERSITVERKDNEIIADQLISHGVTITPAVPGPSEADPNIMDLCFHNGERHMKEKVYKELNRIAKEIPTMTVSQAISMLEGL